MPKKNYEACKEKYDPHTPLKNQETLTASKSNQTLNWTEKSISNYPFVKSYIVPQNS